MLFVSPLQRCLLSPNRTNLLVALSPSVRKYYRSQGTEKSSLQWAAYPVRLCLPYGLKCLCTKPKTPQDFKTLFDLLPPLTYQHKWFLLIEKEKLLSKKLATLLHGRLQKSEIQKHSSFISWWDLKLVNRVKINIEYTKLKHQA